MKKAILASAIIASSAFHPSVKAANLETKQAGVATVGMITAAVAGGPVGMLAAFLGTIYVSEQLENNEEAKQLKQQYTHSQAKVDALSHELKTAHSTIDTFETITLDQLHLQVMFKTGEDTLTPQNEKALTTLAKFLLDNPDLTVRLDGYADPRGTDEYNNVLSQYRADSVKQALMQAGVDKQRIHISAHGSSTTQAIVGDYETYALERRVDIQIINKNELNNVAQVH